MKSKYLLVLVLSLAFVFILGFQSRPDAMITCLGQTPECIKLFQIWAVDNQGAPRGMLPDFPQHIYGTLGGGLSYKWQIYSYHNNSEYLYEVVYIPSGEAEPDVDVNVNSPSITTSNDPVNPNLNPPFYSASTGMSSSQECTFNAAFDNLESNCGTLRFAFRCNNQQCPWCGNVETFRIPVVFNPGEDRPVTVKAYHFINSPNWTEISTQDVIHTNYSLKFSLTFNPSDWLSNRSASFVPNFANNGSGEWNQSNPGAGYGELLSFGMITISHSGTCIVLGYLTDSFDTSQDQCEFIVEP